MINKNKNYILPALIIVIIIIIVLFFFPRKKIVITNQNTSNIVNDFKKGNLSSVIEINQDIDIKESKYYFSEEGFADSLILFKGTDSEKILFTQGEKKIVKIEEGNTQDIINGIKIGDSLSKIIKENGKDFYFYGFEWDGSGLIFNWNSGKFDEDYFSIKLKIASEYNDYVLSELLGDHQIFSGDIDNSKVNIIVESITFKIN